MFKPLIHTLKFISTSCNQKDLQILGNCYKYCASTIFDTVALIFCTSITFLNFKKGKYVLKLLLHGPIQGPHKNL